MAIDAISGSKVEKGGPIADIAGWADRQFRQHLGGRCSSSSR
jgi:hypothetical protein